MTEHESAIKVQVSGENVPWPELDHDIVPVGSSPFTVADNVVGLSIVTEVGSTDTSVVVDAGGAVLVQPHAADVMVTPGVSE